MNFCSGRDAPTLVRVLFVDDLRYRMLRPEINYQIVFSDQLQTVWSGTLQRNPARCEYGSNMSGSLAQVVASLNVRVI